MYKLYVMLLTVVMVIGLFSVPLAAHCYEVGFMVQNSSGVNVSIPIRIYLKNGGARVDNGHLTSYAGAPWDTDYNFRIDFNGNCPPSNPNCLPSCNIISLQEETPYVFYFDYPNGQSKSLCFERAGCGSCYDTFYRIRPSGVTVIENDCCEEEVNCFGTCTPNYAGAVALTIINQQSIGDKIIFTLRATASGGTPINCNQYNYSFQWTNATPSTASNVNPNIASRTILRSQTASVTVQVYINNAGPFTKSVVLADY